MTARHSMREVVRGSLLLHFATSVLRKTQSLHESGVTRILLSLARITMQVSHVRNEPTAGTGLRAKISATGSWAPAARS